MSTDRTLFARGRIGELRQYRVQSVIGYVLAGELAARDRKHALDLPDGFDPRTRALAVTWVHSSTGVKLPIRRMADALGDVNKKRAEADRVLLCVDGVHGFGVE